MSRLLVTPRLRLFTPIRTCPLRTFSVHPLALRPLRRTLASTDVYLVASKSSTLLAKSQGSQVAMSSSASNIGHASVAESTVRNRLEPGLRVTYDELLAHKESGEGESVLKHPKFGSTIHVDMKAILLLAEALEVDPGALRTCTSLCIQSPDESDCHEGIEDDDLFAKKCHALTSVLNNLAEHAQLREFRWMWEQGYGDCGNGRIAPEVWDALARNGGTLEVMNVEHTTVDGSDPWPDSWAAFPSDKYTALRHLTLCMESAHNWDGSGLHKMVKHLANLRSLSLFFPSCCGILKFALSGTYPNLRSFTLSSLFLDDTSAPSEVDKGETTRTFLSRNPTLEHLDLHYDDDSAFCMSTARMELRIGDLPALRALSIDSHTLAVHHTDFAGPLAATPLEALSIGCVPCAASWPFAPCAGGIKYLDVSASLDSQEFPLPGSGYPEGVDYTGVPPEKAEEEEGDEADDETRKVWDEHKNFLDNRREKAGLPRLWRVPVMEDVAPGGSGDAENAMESGDSDFDFEGDAEEPRCIEVRHSDEEQRQQAMDAYFGPEEDMEEDQRLGKLLASMPSLKELRLDVTSRQSLSVAHLNRFIDLVAPPDGPLITPSLTALTLVDTTADVPNFFENLADLSLSRLPKLEYLGWVTREARMTYRLKRKPDGKVVAVEIEPFTKHLREDLWLSEAILDHFGDAAREW